MSLAKNDSNAMAGLYDSTPAFTFSTKGGAGEVFKEGQYTVDPYMKLRLCKANSSKSLLWTDPNSTSEGTSMEIPEEGRLIQAVRGFIVHSRSGYMMFDGKAKQVLCATVQSSFEIEGRSVSYKDQMPVITPLYSPEVYDSPRTPSQNAYRYGLEGSHHGGMSCVDCVSQGLNKREYTDEQGKIQTDTCGATCQVIMVVRDFGIRKTNFATKKTTIEWVSWNRLTISPEVGEPLYTEPPTIAISLSRSVANKSLAKTDAAVGGEYFVPEDSQSWREFQSSMFAEEKVVFPNGSDFRAVVAGLVEMYATSPKMGKEFPTPIKSIPAFRLCTDSSVEETVNPEALGRSISYAINKFNEDFVAAGGYLDDDGVTPLTTKKVVSTGNVFGMKSADVAPKTIEATSSPVQEIEPMEVESKEVVIDEPTNKVSMDDIEKSISAEVEEMDLF